MGTTNRSFRDLRENLINIHSKLGSPAIVVQKAIKSLAHKTARYYGQTSKHKPHQGERERARRLTIGSAAWYSGRVMNKQAVKS